MSRQIDVTKKLTKDEVAYLQARGMQGVLDANALALMGGGADEAAVEKAETEKAEPEAETPAETEVEAEAEAEKPKRGSKK